MPHHRNPKPFLIMAENKKAFVAYCDWLESFEELTDEEAGKLAKHLFRYVNDLNPEAPDRMTKMCFIPIKQSLKRDLLKYEERAERARINGLKGGRPKTQKTQSVISEPRKADRVTVTDRDSVKVINKKGDYFSNEKLNQCFSLWLKMCEEKGKNRTTTSIEAIVMKMQYKTTEQNITEVEQALENGWLNLYSIKPKTYDKKTEKPVYDAPQSVKKALNDLANKMKV